jgi:hypothetical protein
VPRKVRSRHDRRREALAQWLREQEIDSLKRELSVDARKHDRRV